MQSLASRWLPNSDCTPISEDNGVPTSASLLSYTRRSTSNRCGSLMRLVTFPKLWDRFEDRGRIITTGFCISLCRLRNTSITRMPLISTLVYATCAFSLLLSLWTWTAPAFRRKKCRCSQVVVNRSLSVGLLCSHQTRSTISLPMKSAISGSRCMAACWIGRNSLFCYSC